MPRSGGSPSRPWFKTAGLSPVWPAPLTYSICKFIHVLGTVLLLGNVTVTSVWKVFADRTRVPATVAHAQRLVAGTDWAFTAGGALLIVVGGYGMAWTTGMRLTMPWLLWG